MVFSCSISYSSSASSCSVVPPNPPHLARTPHFPSQTMSPSKMISAFSAPPISITRFHPIIPNQQFFYASSTTNTIPTTFTMDSNNSFWSRWATKKSLCNTCTKFVSSNKCFTSFSSFLQVININRTPPVSSIPQSMFIISPSPITNLTS
ncbi:unnamed protein product [Vicia faba]|uniref:Uncharacterized protein n=1 Tax=Vicia faba TaxID=3906 RepID=A0AAV0YH57_VICFA|nr:unnamed protein product [Vicia faba]